MHIEVHCCIRSIGIHIVQHKLRCRFQIVELRIHLIGIRIALFTGCGVDLVMLQTDHIPICPCQGLGRCVRSIVLPCAALSADHTQGITAVALLRLGGMPVKTLTAAVTQTHGDLCVLTQHGLQNVQHLTVGHAGIGCVLGEGVADEQNLEYFLNIQRHTGLSNIRAEAAIVNGKTYIAATCKETLTHRSQPAGQCHSQRCVIALRNSKYTIAYHFQPMGKFHFRQRSVIRKCVIRNGCHTVRNHDLCDLVNHRCPGLILSSDFRVFHQRFQHQNTVAQFIMNIAKIAFHIVVQIHIAASVCFRISAHIVFRAVAVKRQILQLLTGIEHRITCMETCVGILDNNVGEGCAGGSGIETEGIIRKVGYRRRDGNACHGADKGVHESILVDLNKGIRERNPFQIDKIRKAATGRLCNALFDNQVFNLIAIRVIGLVIATPVGAVYRTAARNDHGAIGIQCVGNSICIRRAISHIAGGNHSHFHSAELHMAALLAVTALFARLLIGSLSGHIPIREIVTIRFHIIIHITVTAPAGIGGIALLRAGGGSDHSCVCMHMLRTVLPHLNVVNIAISDGVGVGSHMGKDQILPVQPVHSLFFIRSANPVVIHRTNFLIIHIQVNHIGTICVDPVFQLVSMINSSVNAVCTQFDTVIVVLSTGTYTKCDKIAVVAAIQIGGIRCCAGLRACKQQRTVGGIRPCAFGLPLNDPRLIVFQDHGITQGVLHLAELAVGNAAADHCQLVFCITACRNANQGILLGIIFPAEALGIPILQGSRNLHIAADRWNLNNTISVALCGYVHAAHFHRHN